MRSRVAHDAEGDLEVSRQPGVEIARQHVLKLHQEAAAFQQFAQGRTVIGNDIGHPTRLFAGLRITNHI